MKLNHIYESVDLFQLTTRTIQKKYLITDKAPLFRHHSRLRGNPVISTRSGSKSTLISRLRENDGAEDFLRDCHLSKNNKNNSLLYDFVPDGHG